MIYLLRHGETEWNRKGIMQGHWDSPLTDKGKQQAQAMGEYLAAVLANINKTQIHVVSSHLGRTKATATIVREFIGLPESASSISELLAEHHLGEWQGLTYEEIEQRWPGILAERQASKWTFRVPGGESYALLSQRAQNWLAQERKHTVTIVVTHEQLSRTLQGVYADLSIPKTLALDHKQDCLYHLNQGKIRKICLA